MKNDPVDRALNRPAVRKYVPDNTDQKGLQSSFDESDWGWIVEVFENGNWKTIYGPVSTHDGAKTKIPGDPNIKYRIRGSADLGKVLKDSIAKQKEGSRPK